MYSGAWNKEFKRKKMPIMLLLFLQSLQIVTFLLTVCHVIVVVQDWFTDINIMRYNAAEQIRFLFSLPIC